MKTINQRMAHWRATGGALDAAAADGGRRDDGLAAYTPTLGHPGCAGGADDGLAATAYTTPGSPTCFQGDDGLTSAFTFSLAPQCADGGLAAAHPSFEVPCRADDGLAACEFSTGWRCFVDDGLTAGGYTTSFCPVMGPDHGLAAGAAPTGAHSCWWAPA